MHTKKARMTEWDVDGDGEECANERMVSILNDDVHCTLVVLVEHMYVRLLLVHAFQIQRHRRFRRHHYSPPGADIDLEWKYYTKKATRTKTRNVKAEKKNERMKEKKGEEKKQKK